MHNALVEEVFANNRKTGYLLVSRGAKDQNEMVYIELLRLNIGRDTVIENQSGEPLCLYDIQKGMWINAEFSSAITKSIPPQSSAFKITVLGKIPSVSTTTDRVAIIDLNNNFLYTGDPNNIDDQMRFVISNKTIILDKNGNPIRLDQIRPGQLARVEHTSFQTLSIPPQSLAFRIQML
ncbi:hypothetical protein SDC9_163298 [bioreactor metagenome]|uniref:Uncharacterized protein n=1 Tax=bioreactor metagenome TaxID=1076179 RepID=A0A645FQS0_9ZZZZ